MRESDILTKRPLGVQHKPSNYLHQDTPSHSAKGALKFNASI